MVLSGQSELSESKMERVEPEGHQGGLWPLWGMTHTCKAFRAYWKGRKAQKNPCSLQGRSEGGAGRGHVYTQRTPISPSSQC